MLGHVEAMICDLRSSPWAVPPSRKQVGRWAATLLGTGRGWAHRAVVAGPDRMSCRSRGSGSKTSPSRLDARDLAHLLAAGAAQPGQYAPASDERCDEVGQRAGTASCSDQQIGVGSPLARRRVSLRSTGPGCTHPHWRHRDPYPPPAPPGASYRLNDRDPAASA